jgi:hypothetical protein
MTIQIVVLGFVLNFVNAQLLFSMIASSWIVRMLDGRPQITSGLSTINHESVVFESSSPLFLEVVVGSQFHASSSTWIRTFFIQPILEQI